MTSGESAILRLSSAYEKELRSIKTEIEEFILSKLKKLEDIEKPKFYSEVNLFAVGNVFV